jgi:tetratricopeptide (TPR) repeat protein
LSLESRKNTALDDPGAELLDKATALWDHYGRIFLGVLVGLVVVGVAASYIVSGNRTRENTASEKLAEANDLFWRADYDRSRQLAQDLAKQFPGTASGIDALRISGDDAYWRGNWKDAIADYNAYLAKRNSGMIPDAVRRSLAYALESNGQYLDAAAQYEKLVGVFDRESSAEMLFAAARCMVAANKPDEARKRYQRILDEFPDSSFQLQVRIALGRLAPVTLN